MWNEILLTHVSDQVELMLSLLVLPFPSNLNKPSNYLQINCGHKHLSITYEISKNKSILTLNPHKFERQSETYRRHVARLNRKERAGDDAAVT